MNKELLLSAMTAMALAAGIDTQEIQKSFNAGIKTQEHPLIKFAKGEITPEDLAVSGEISPTRAAHFIDLIQKSDEFLKKVTVIPMDQLTTTYDVWDMLRGSLVRVPEGQEPTEEQKKKIQNAGRKLSAKPVQLFADVTRSSILSNMHHPNFAAFLDSKFANRFAGDITYLGFVGSSDEYENADFKELNKGWIQVALDENGTNKVEYAEDDTMVDRLEKLVKSADDDLGDDARILIHRNDFLDYCLEVGKSTNTSELLIQAAAQGFAGYRFEITNNMPSGTYMLTPLKNLVFGMVSKIYRARKFNERKRAVEYTFDAHIDYDIAVPKFVSLATLSS